MRRYGLLVLALVLVVFSWGVAGCAGADGGAERLTIGIYAPGLVPRSLYVAQEAGYFDDEGLQVTFEAYESGVAAVQALENGEVDLACASEYVLASSSFARPDLRAVTELLSSTTAVGLIVRADGGIDHVADWLADGRHRRGHVGSLLSRSEPCGGRDRAGHGRCGVSSPWGDGAGSRDRRVRRGLHLGTTGERDRARPGPDRAVA